MGMLRAPALVPSLASRSDENQGKGSTAMTERLLAVGDLGLLHRVHGEYMEMPGLRLTVAQACRLWNVDPVTSRDVLNQLVENQFLRVSGPHYVRAAAGRSLARV
jgi:hypothetical protein